MEIDAQLVACGWVVQDYQHAAVAAAKGVAVREVQTEAGRADYVLYVDRQAVGVIEAKKAGTTAQEGARGAGQYFTPRALISVIVDVMQPEPSDRICDPACGTGGFFLDAYRSIIERFTPLEPDQVAHLRSGAFTGWEIADLPARLCAMNLLLHGIESPESDSPVHVDDALRSDPGERFDMVLTNPPFGRASDSYEREDFWATTRNKQLNFVQHVWWCPTTCSSKPERARPSAAGCYTIVRSTPCCACPPASSTPRV